PRIDPPVAGLLGADVLAGFDVEIDGPGKRLALHEPGAGCVPPWPSESVPLRRTGDRLSVTARLDGRPVEALIDTGSLSVVLDIEAALGFGVGRAALARDPGGISGGVDMREATYHWHRFASLAVGPVVTRNPVMTVTGIGEQAPMLLGASWFAPRRVWLSFATRRMFIAR
ncbi:MAG: retropepsin-like domain-containing protein, partial [Acetobacteraceae bacterium]|nr:retropepsin-like domain-containing protein [Acetobacteraceae bacterium]